MNPYRVLALHGISVAISIGVFHQPVARATAATGGIPARQFALSPPVR